VNDVNIRRAGAVRAAVDVAERYGIGIGSARVIEDTTDTKVWLAPHPLLAKVAVTTADRRRARALLTELRIVRHLADVGAPVVAPSTELPVRVHLEDRYAITFWEYHPAPERRRSVDPVDAARSLRELHAALTTYPLPLEPLVDQMAAVGEALADGHRLRGLPASDRLFLQAVHSRVVERVVERHPAAVPLHGDPGPGNLLAGGEGFLWIDFESACSGPVEWDLTVLPGGGAGVFPDADPELRRLLGDLRSVSVAVRSWLQPDRPAALDDTARRHLARLRKG
jgi:Phosphotransferase enzyme family